MTDDGMLLTPSGAGAWIIQYKLLTDTGLSKGDTVTLTVRADGTVYSGSATLQIKSAAVDADSMVDTDGKAHLPQGGRYSQSEVESKRYTVRGIQTKSRCISS